jgi:hypothetical protein
VERGAGVPARREGRGREGRGRGPGAQGGAGLESLAPRRGGARDYQRVERGAGEQALTQGWGETGIQARTGSRGWIQKRTEGLGEAGREPGTRGGRGGVVGRRRQLGLLLTHSK